MRCPKCGYNSFDHLDSCKKCGKDLVEHKQKFGIVSVLFPGQMKPVTTAESAEDENVVDAAMAAATATAAVGAGAAVADSLVEEEAPSGSSGDGDDFGFDFMGDSEEDEDLSFDELFEEAPAEEDVEETLPSPEAEADDAADGFAFEVDDDEGVAEGAELEDDFGFDPTDIDGEGAEESTAEPDEIDLGLDPAEPEKAEAVEKPAPETDDMVDFGFETDQEPEAAETDGAEAESDALDDFSFDSDNVEFDDGEEEDSGVEEDPKDPFDLPGSSLQEGAPEEKSNVDHYQDDGDSSVAEESDVLAEADLGLLDEHPAEVDPGEDPFSVSGELDPGSGVEEFPPPESAPAADCLVDSQDDQPVVTEPADVDRFSEAEHGAGFEAEPETFAENVDVDAAAAAATPTAVATVAATEEPEEFTQEADAELLPETGSRVLAFCCDLLLLTVVGTSFVVAAEAAMSPEASSLLPTKETLIDLSVPYFLVLFSLAFGYFTLFHFLVGQTPGKMLTGLRVETVAGEPLLFSQAFLRSVGGLLQALPAGLGYLTALLSADRRGWNDRLAGTRLISLKGLSEDI